MAFIWTASTAFLSEGCQVYTKSTPSKAPALAMNCLDPAPSSAGQPKYMMVPSPPLSSSQAFIAMAAAREPVPRLQCPQPCPVLGQPSLGFFFVIPASWLSPERASYSPSMPMTGFPLPTDASAVKAVGMPAMPFFTLKPAFPSMSSRSSADLYSWKASSA